MTEKIYSLTLQVILVIFLLNTSCKKEQSPVVKTGDISDVTGSGAFSGGTVLDEGTSAIISAGVCWSEGTQPTISDSKSTDQVTTGEFASEIKGLKPLTRYYVRAYATNSEGTGYGDTVSFKTFGGPPSIKQWWTGDIKTTYVRLYVTVNPNYVSTTVSFEYGLNPNSTKTVIVDQGAVTAGQDTTLTLTLSDLASGTRYFFRIKAESSLGSVVSDYFSFGTPITGNTGTVSDIQGNTYKTIGIGWQNWMSENLRVTKYNDGTPIENIKDSLAWMSPSGPAYCDYRNDSTISLTFGRLYNWYTVTTANPKNVCPAGWHVPTSLDWSTLISFLQTFGYSCDSSGFKIAKSLASPFGWNPSDVIASPGNTDYPSMRNKSGFNAMAGGFRSIATFGYFEGEHGYIGDIETWWSSAMKSSTEAYNFMMMSSFTGLIQGSDNKVSGMHIRCIQDN